MRVRSEARRLAYIHAAGDMFLRQGYADVSMESVAAAVGGSKVTLYGYFSSKEALFEAFVIEVGRGTAQGFFEFEVLSGDDLGTLHELGFAYLKLITSPEILALDRLIISEAIRFPKLTRIFYEHGPKRVVDTMTDVLKQLSIGQCMRTAQARRVALHFKALCEATIRDRQLWCLDGPPNDRTLRTAVKTAVPMFFDGYKSAIVTSALASRTRRLSRMVR